MHEKSFYRVKILKATNAPQARAASSFTRETFTSGFHLETNLGFLEITFSKIPKIFNSKITSSDWLNYSS